eukprot:15363437-Ditylum_brightwellii.AAC.1
MGHDWKFDEETALMVTSKRKEGDSVMAARIHGGYKDYVRMMVEKHMQYGQSIKDGDNMIMLGKEELCVLLPSLSDYFATKTNLGQNEQKHHQFLLCSCHCGEGVHDRIHKCTMLSTEEYKKKHDRSKCMWSYKSKEDVQYDKKKHADCRDKHNNGVTHYGVEPALLPCENI